MCTVHTFSYSGFYDYKLHAGMGGTSLITVFHGYYVKTSDKTDRIQLCYCPTHFYPLLGPGSLAAKWQWFLAAPPTLSSPYQAIASSSFSSRRYFLKS